MQEDEKSTGKRIFSINGITAPHYRLIPIVGRFIFLCRPQSPLIRGLPRIGVRLGP